MGLITPIHTNKGYLEIIAFLNNEVVSPSTGLHSQVVYDMIQTLPTNDFWFYVQEVYSDSDTYKGSFMLLPDLRLLYIENERCKYVNFNNSEVSTIFKMLYNQLEEFYSSTVPLYDTDTAVSSGQCEISGLFEYGSDVWYQKLREGVNNTVTATAPIRVPVVKGARCCNYMMKVDLNPYGIITMRGARNTVTKFEIRTGDTTDTSLAVVWKFEYNNMDDVMAVPDTPESRVSVERLIKEGVVFANL